MKDFKTLSAALIETVNGFGIVRCEEKEVNSYGELVGHKKVWYDVCDDNGEGDILESYKTLKAARNAAKAM